MRKRILAMVLTLMVVVGVGAGLGYQHHVALAARQVAAVDYSVRGPSAGADKYGNQYVFWEDTNNNLVEAKYDNYSHGWSSFNPGGENNVGPLGSEPSVAVQDDGGYAVGNDLYGDQFVYWRGTTDGKLWYMYNNVSGWHGQYPVPGVTGVGSEVSAVYNDIQNGSQQVTVFWEGTNGDLYFLRLQNPGSTSPTVFGPFDTGIGGLGSSPGASPSTLTSAGNGSGVVVWKGDTNQNVQYATYTVGEQNGQITVSYVGALNLNLYTNDNSGPSAAVNPFTTDFYYAWEDSSHDLWDAKNTDTLEQVTSNGNLASAPSIAVSQTLADEKFIFYKGQDDYLHEAFYAPDSEGTWGWHYTTFSTFGALG